MSAFFTAVACLDHPTAEELLVPRQISCLLEALVAVPDPRDPRGMRFDLPLLLGLAVFPACCGAATFDEVAEVVADLPDFLAAGFGLVRTAPSAATFRRIINATDPTALDEAPSVWAPGPGVARALENGEGLAGVRDPAPERVQSEETARLRKIEAG